ncbi:ATP-dependent acyl-CoA ligase [Amycolatopsis sp. K13G38]|uniref:ATP-dependent acyl-CoA ligase n=1 Tax=Amycolatopsis acididurans TaxID=2724524 RepID=A0ABX1JF08_9PSEU|nr:AMP-binding protein [Amycolatopsis acididurans]NKQ58208.1 ATP-dependent acyl-CoA ligase [Amycolatopsis acididurans]
MTGKTVWETLSLAAQRWPDHTFLRTRDGALSYSQVLAKGNARAEGLLIRGLRPGDHGIIVMRNSLDHVITWFALNALGATAVPVNPRLTDEQLAHQVRVADAAAVFADDDEAHRLDLLLTGQHIRVAAARHVEGGAIPDTWCPLTDLDHPVSAPHATNHDSRPGTSAMVLFTSGTTGPPKGCILSNHYLVRQGELLAKYLELRQSDVLYCPFPLFHADAITYTIMAALAVGGTAAIGRKYSTTEFWDEIAYFGATVFDFMGATLTMLHHRPSQANDRENTVRLAWGVPVPPFAAEFEQRFDLRVVELYGSTDAGMPIAHPLHEPRRLGSCGQVIPEYDIRVVDSRGAIVEAGEVGELEVTSREPHLLSEGYRGMAEATAASRRGRWLRTGDLVRRDEQGWVYFVGRASDVIRRRGENISAIDIESAIEKHPAVSECAAYGVPSPMTEDDVMLSYVVTAGETLSPAALAAFCTEVLPAFMVPRYLRPLDALPHTPTEKVAKTTLKREGVTADTWDRERA